MCSLPLGGHELPAVEAEERQMSHNGKLPLMGLSVLGGGWGEAV